MPYCHTPTSPILQAYSSLPYPAARLYHTYHNISYHITFNPLSSTQQLIPHDGHSPSSHDSSMMSLVQFAEPVTVRRCRSRMRVTIHETLARNHCARHCTRRRPSGRRRHLAHATDLRSPLRHCPRCQSLTNAFTVRPSGVCRWRLSRRCTAADDAMEHC